MALMRSVRRHIYPSGKNLSLTIEIVVEGNRVKFEIGNTTFIVTYSNNNTFGIYKNHGSYFRPDERIE
jgi:hypothetical protein